MQKICLLNLRRMVIFTALFLCAGALFATTRYVATNSTPASPFTNWADAAATIAQAYGVCDPGDVIIVSNGVYVVKLLTISAAKPVQIRSLNGPKKTFLNADNSWALYLHPGSVLDGFTITNGYNTTSTSTIILSGSTIRNCVLQANSGDGTARGGAIYMIGGNSTVSNCLLLDNSTGGSGGAIYVRSDTNNIIADSILHNNQSTNSGGAIHVFGGTLECRNLLIYSNRSVTSTGGGINGNTSTMLLNCTITLNRSGNHGGGVYNAVGAYNTIIHGNTSPTFTAWTNWSSSANFTNCCIGWQSSPAILGANNFTNAPEFTDQYAGNFHLNRSSPCINTGTNLPWMHNAFDLEGRQRIDRFSGMVDIGCYEYFVRGTMILLR